MIEPLARCNDCYRGISSAEMTEWSKGRAGEYALVWWHWQVEGICDRCSDDIGANRERE